MDSSRPPPSPSSRPPTLRDIARRAGVSAMAVSAALRNQPKTSLATRERIQQIARELGYRPDPEVACLMRHLRQRTKPAFQGLLCALTTRSPTERNAFTDAVLAGARQRAKSLGYAFDCFSVPATAKSNCPLSRILHARGVHGLLLLPMSRSVDLQPLLPWDEFPTVAATSSVIAPAVHRVLPHHYANTLALFTHLHGLGYRRIGLVLHRAQDERVQHLFAAVACWFGQFARGAKAIRPLILEAGSTDGFLAWFKREEPDALVVTDEEKAAAFNRLLRSQRPPAIACTSVASDSPWPSIDECPAAIGAASIDVLVAASQRGEKGLPSQPASSLVPGRWHAGRSEKLRPAAQLRSRA